MNKKDRVGEPLSHKKLSKNGSGVKKIRGIYKAWLKAPSYVLKQLCSNHNVKVYVGTHGNVTTQKDKAKKFKYGYDSEEVKIKFWSEKLGLRFTTEKA